MAVRNDEILEQVRVRTDPEVGLAYCYDVIQDAADRFDCNKTDAIVRACDFASPIVDGDQEALAHSDLPPPLAEIISSRHVDVKYQGPRVRVDLD